MQPSVSQYKWSPEESNGLTPYSVLGFQSADCKARGSFKTPGLKFGSGNSSELHLGDG